MRRGGRGAVRTTYLDRQSLEGHFGTGRVPGTGGGEGNGGAGAAAPPPVPSAHVPSVTSYRFHTYHESPHPSASHFS